MPRDISPQIAAPTTPRSAVQQVALAALLAGATTTAAAKAAGIDRSTLIRWTQNDAEFIAMYNSFRCEMADAIRRRLACLAVDAVAAIQRLINDEDAPPAARLRAASEVLRLAALDAPTGPTDPAEVRRAIDRRERYRTLGLDPDRPARGV